MALTEQQVRNIIRDELSDFITNERYIFQKHLQIFNGRNIQFGRTNGTKFGTATDQKISFHNAVPVIQASHIADPAGGATTDAEARTAINDILVVLENKGFVAIS